MRLLSEDHLARLLWQAVERLDVSAFAADLVVVERAPAGRRPTRGCW
jgi:hypothetical protein